MTNARIILFVFLALLLPVQSQANESPLYIGLGFSDFTPDGAGYSMSGYTANLGFDMNNLLAFEVSYSNSSAATESISVVTINPRVKYIGTGMLRANLRFNYFTIYALAGGYTSKVDLDIDIAGFTANGTIDSKGYAFGGGVNFFGTKDAALDARWIRYIDADADEYVIDHFMIGLHIYFDVPQVYGRY